MKWTRAILTYYMITLQCMHTFEDQTDHSASVNRAYTHTWNMQLWDIF